jgi:hypothetical protein
VSIYSCGDDNFPKDNGRYLYLCTDKGNVIANALDVSGIPHTGTFSDNEIRFSYDADYVDSVEEIIGKSNSGEYDEMLREIKEHKDDSSYLILLPTVAHYLHLTEGTLRKRPDELQIQLCQMFAQLWCCDTLTIQRELTRVLNANRQTEQDMEEAREREIQQNNTPEKREAVNMADIRHRQNVVKGDEDYQEKAELSEKEEARTCLISREVIRRQAEIIKRKQAVKQKSVAEKAERERKF